VNAEMAGFKVGTTLYQLYACGRPGKDETNPTRGGLDNCGDALKLGDMVTTSQCTSSKYGDEKLHIVHQRIEEDWAANSDYLKGYDVDKSCGWNLLPMPRSPPKKCISQQNKRGPFVV